MITIHGLPPDAVVAYLAMITALSALLLQGIKIVFVDPHMKDGEARNWLLRIIGGTITFLLVCLLLFTHRSFDPAFLLDYIGYAFGLQSLGHVGYQLITTVSTPKGSTTVSNGDSTPMMETPSGGDPSGAEPIK